MVCGRVFERAQWLVERNARCKRRNCCGRECAGRVVASTGMTACTACGTRRCTETFKCVTCGHRFNACRRLVGGFDATKKECTRCYELREFGPAWEQFWQPKKGQLRSQAQIDEAVRQAQEWGLPFRAEGVE